MEIQLIGQKQGSAHTIDIVKDRYTECDKCRSRITTALECECEFTLEEGDKKMELCKKCTREFILLLKDQGYRITDFSDVSYK